MHSEVGEESAMVGHWVYLSVKLQPYVEEDRYLIYPKPDSYF